MSRPTQVLAATPAARTAVYPTHPSSAIRKIAKVELTKKLDAVVRPDVNSLYRGTAQSTVGQGHRLSVKRPTPAIALTAHSGGDTRSLACLAKGYMNLAHVAR